MMTAASHDTAPTDTVTTDAVSFAPGFRSDDVRANYWLRQATLRMRREITWLRHERGLLPEAPPSMLPPRQDPAQAALDLTRFHVAKLHFFETDPTARYLTEQLSASPPVHNGRVRRGSFGWVADKLSLDHAATFVLALALLPALDASAGSVIAACLDDASKPTPTLALAQRLWAEPGAMMALADPAHPLFRCGLLERRSDEGLETAWHQPLHTPAPVARQLLHPESAPPPSLIPIRGASGEASPNPQVSLLAARLAAGSGDALRVVPVRGKCGAAFAETASAVAREAGLSLVQAAIAPHLLRQRGAADALATLSWLRGEALFLDDALVSALTDASHGLPAHCPPAASIPAIVFLGLRERTPLPALPDTCLLPAISVPPLSYAERVARWQAALGPRARSIDAPLREAARRFRFEPHTIDAVASGLKALPHPLSEQDLLSACRAEVTFDIDALAQPVTSRFDADALMLPPKQAQQFEELTRAMQALTRVHYEWGTAKTWNEGGITALFAGPPGTGKTMAAEVLATRLDLPMYRIDLSQVVSKYIGETEKNLKRLFDAADRADTLLFFDEADALFGQRTEVKDAHDRYANLEISYLLERMERFKGLAILATNRRRDLDEAFLRRLRFAIDFPLPDAAQRRRIWEQVLPEPVDASALDLDFLANQYQLAGGHIRSVVFAACLQSAGAPDASAAAPRTLTMDQVVVAVKREYDKLNRPISLKHFGPYAPLITDLEADA